MSEATRFEPPVTDVSEPFWDATRDGKLILQWCPSCEEPVWFPRDVCPGCLGTDLEWRGSPGEGQVYACSVEHKAQTRALDAPYVVALVELDEGVRLLSNIVDCPPESVSVGDRVRVTWEPLSDGRRLPLFTPVA